MGKWNSRSQRMFRRPKSPASPPFYDINAPLPEFWQDGIPLWEKEYCTMIGLLPWDKIVASKDLIYWYSNVLDWNDSAAEEAFQNAKKRYWAKINGFPCDISLPDPDMYVDHMDWNPYIDPELIKELDSAFFALPDEEQEDAMKNKRIKTSVNRENPPECNVTPLGLALENKALGWNQVDYHVGVSGNVDNNNNPWESSIAHGNGELTDNTREGVHANSWHWNEGRDHNRDWNSGYSQKNKGWGKVRDGSWSQHQSNNLANIGNSWDRKFSQQDVTPINTGWRNSRANVSGWKQQEKADVSSDMQFRRNYRGWNASNQSYQRRDGSNRHTSGFNGPQFQRDDRQTSHYWRKDRSRKRGFAL